MREGGREGVMEAGFLFLWVWSGLVRLVEREGGRQGGIDGGREGGGRDEGRGRGRDKTYVYMCACPEFSATPWCHWADLVQ